MPVLYKRMIKYFKKQKIDKIIYHALYNKLSYARILIGSHDDVIIKTFALCFYYIKQIDSNLPCVF